MGLGVAALGLYTVYKGGTKQFENTLRTREMSPSVRTWSMRLGTLAYVVKGVIFLLFSWFLLQAALTYDANKAAQGLDAALRRVAEAGWGTALLTFVAAGLFAYGLFCGVEARYRRVGVSATGTA